VVRSCEIAALKASEESHAQQAFRGQQAQRDGRKLLRAASMIFAALIGLCVLGLIAL